MSSTFQAITRVVTRGFDRSAQRHLTKPNSCWDLLNMKPVLGRLEQTPWMQTFTALTKLTSETTDTATHFIRLVKNVAGNLRYLVLNETNARFIDPTAPATQTLIPCVLQTAKPDNATLTGECLLYGINATDFAAAGDQIDIKIASSSTFQVQRNGGGYGAAVPIASSVLLSINGLYVAFQGAGALTDFVNFTPGQIWSWKRFDTLPATDYSNTTFNLSYPSDCYNNDIYIGGVARNILRVRNNFITSVGYTRAYGMHVAIFYNHLFISQYAPGVYSAGSGIVDGYNAQTTPFTLGWSHLNNPDQLFATLINEADQKTLPQQQFYELANMGITGLAPWRNLLYVFLTDSIWSVQYVGLPNVMLISPLNSNVGSYFKSGVVRTPTGIYFIGRSDFYCISEYEPVSIGLKVRTKFFTEICAISDNNHQRTFGFYNPYSKEVIWTYWVLISTGVYQVRQIVYSEITQDWYFRNIPSTSSGYSDSYAGCPHYNTFGQNIYGYNQNLYIDQAAGATTGALMDTYIGGVAAYTTPFFETPFLDFNDPYHIKESSGLHIDASWVAGTQIQVSQATSDLIGNGNPTMVALTQKWTPNISPEVRLSAPRTSFRQEAFKFEIQKTVPPVYGAVFNLFQEFVSGPSTTVEK
jgi:hypothetical protein